MTYRDYGDQAEHLWLACGRFTTRDGVIDLTEKTFIRFLGHDGKARCVICGPNSITANAALDAANVPHRTWIRVGSMAVLFDWDYIACVKEYLVRIFGEEPKLFAIDCSRSSVARALVGYRKRRDTMLVKAGAA